MVDLEKAYRVGRGVLGALDSLWEHLVTHGIPPLAFVLHKESYVFLWEDGSAMGAGELFGWGSRR